MIPRYTLPEMAAIWSETARFERMLEVELAVVRAQVARGQVPADALVAIEAGGLRPDRGHLGQRVAWDHGALPTAAGSTRSAPMS